MYLIIENLLHFSNFVHSAQYLENRIQPIHAIFSTFLRQNKSLLFHFSSCNAPDLKTQFLRFWNLPPHTYGIYPYSIPYTGINDTLHVRISLS